MTFAIVAGLFFVVWGFVLLWAGVGVFQSLRAERLRGSLAQSAGWYRARSAVTLAAFWLMGLGLVCFGVTVLRYAAGYFIAIPVRGPLVDQVLSVAGIALPAAGFILLFVSIWLERKG